MSFDFNYRIGGTALDTYGSNVRLIEGLSGQRAEMLEIAYRHGVYVADRHWSKARLMQIQIRFDAVTQAIGSTWGDKRNFEALIGGGKKTLTRADPDVGADVECEIISVDEVDQPEGAERFYWPYEIWQTRGYWEEATASIDQDDLALGASATISLPAVGGTHRTEPVYTITCQTAGSNPALELQTALDKLSIVGAFINSDVIVIDVADRLVTKNGTREKNLLRVNRGFWTEFDEGSTNSVDFTSDSGVWDVNTTVKDRYR